jgi:hypothetical protein
VFKDLFTTVLAICRVDKDAARRVSRWAALIDAIAYGRLQRRWTLVLEAGENQQLRSVFLKVEARVETLWLAQNPSCAL